MPTQFVINARQIATKVATMHEHNRVGVINAINYPTNYVISSKDKVMYQAKMNKFIFIELRRYSISLHDTDVTALIDTKCNNH